MELNEVLKKENDRLSQKVRGQEISIERYQQTIKAQKALIDLMEDQKKLISDLIIGKYGYMQLRRALINIEIENIEGIGI